LARKHQTILMTGIATCCSQSVDSGLILSLK